MRSDTDIDPQTSRLAVGRGPRPAHLRVLRAASWAALLTQISYFAVKRFPEWYTWVAFAGAVACVASLVIVVLLRRRGTSTTDIAWSLRPALWASPIAIVVVGITLLSLGENLAVKLFDIKLAK